MLNGLLVSYFHCYINANTTEALVCNPKNFWTSSSSSSSSSSSFSSSSSSSSSSSTWFSSASLSFRWAFKQILNNYFCHYCHVVTVVIERWVASACVREITWVNINAIGSMIRSTYSNDIVPLLHYQNNEIHTDNIDDKNKQLQSILRYLQLNYQDDSLRSNCVNNQTN